MASKAPSSALAARVNKTLATNPSLKGRTALMGALTVMFDAASGKEIDACISLALEMTKRPLVFRGFLAKGTKSTRYAAPKAMSAARKVITDTVGSYRAFPKESTMVYIHDGAPEKLPPKEFALYLTLEAGETGVLSIAFPLDEVTEPRWQALGDQVVERLGASVALLGPAVWLAPLSLFNSSGNQIDSAALVAALCSVDPQLDIPSWFSDHRLTREELKPSKHGLVSPSWIMWLDKSLAPKRYRGRHEKLASSTRFHAADGTPFEMTDDRYTAWHDAWADLASTRRTLKDDSEIYGPYTRRFDDDSLEAMRARWTGDQADEEDAEARSLEIEVKISKLVDKPAALLKYVRPLIGELATNHLWELLPRFTEYVAEGHVDAAEAKVWLDATDKLDDARLFVAAAGLATAVGDSERAIDLLRRALKRNAQNANKKQIKKDPLFRALRTEKQFIALVK